MKANRIKLDELMEEFLCREITFEKFQKAYSSCYIDDEGDKTFSQEEVEHYGVVHEKAEWTTEKPTLEERQYGWITPEEFREWLSMHESEKPLL